MQALNHIRTVLILFGILSCSQLLAKDEVVYFHNDLLGSATLAYNEAGDICWKQAYSPFGDQTSDEDLVPVSGCGLLGRERGFTGHTQDTSGLVYMEQRYYDPSIMRFVSRDPVNVLPEDERTFNRYHYAANNPYKYVDPHGEVIFLFALTPIAAAIAKELAAEGVSLGVSVLTNGTVNNAGDFLSTRKVAIKAARKFAKSGASRLADKAQSLPGKQRPNTVAVINHKDGIVTVGRNQGGVQNSTVQNALDNAPANCFAGQCAEVNALSRALNKGRSLDGASISVSNVRGSVSTSGIHGTAKAPCRTCASVLDQLGVGQ